MKNNKLQSAKFSIVIACFNSSNFIPKTIESILGQSYQNFEILFVDDGSTDNSLSIIRKYSKNDKRIKVLKNTINQGVSVTRNKALENVTGQYICFLDCDDWWPHDKLKIYLQLYKQGYELIYSSFTKLYLNSGKSNLIKVDIEASYNKIIFSNLIPFSSASYDAKKLGIHKFTTEYFPEDWIYWIEIFKKNPRAIGIKNSLMFYTISGTNASKNKFIMLQKAWFIFRKYQKFSFFRSLYSLLFFIYYGIRKNF